jgi:hypothetical protein
VGNDVAGLQLERAKPTVSALSPAPDVKPDRDKKRSNTGTTQFGIFILYTSWIHICSDFRQSYSLTDAYLFLLTEESLHRDRIQAYSLGGLLARLQRHYCTFEQLAVHVYTCLSLAIDPQLRLSISRRVAIHPLLSI